MRRARRAPAGMLLALALVACAPAGDAPLARSGPLGSLRDLVLFDRSEAAGGPFFLDRFEVTRADWAQFAATAEGRAVGARAPAIPTRAEAALPKASVDLRQARAFARWRRCRLPRAPEWEFACTGGSRYAFPWGDIFDPARANTAELGLGAPLPVGTFESGRRGDGPYDLIGNVAEWTETVPGSWFRADRRALPPVAVATQRVRRAPALAIWCWSPAIVPPIFVVQAGDPMAPRELRGADFLSSPTDRSEPRPPTDYSDTLGVRLCTTPGELLAAVAADPAGYAPADLEQLRRFLRRGQNAQALRVALERMPADAKARAFFGPMLGEL